MAWKQKNEIRGLDNVLSPTGKIGFKLSKCQSELFTETIEVRPNQNGFERCRVFHDLVIRTRMSSNCFKLPNAEGVGEAQAANAAQRQLGVS